MSNTVYRFENKSAKTANTAWMLKLKPVKEHYVHGMLSRRQFVE